MLQILNLDAISDLENLTMMFPLQIVPLVNPEAFRHFSFEVLGAAPPIGRVPTRFQGFVLAFMVSTFRLHFQYDIQFAFMVSQFRFPSKLISVCFHIAILFVFIILFILYTILDCIISFNNVCILEKDNTILPK